MDKEQTTSVVKGSNIGPETVRFLQRMEAKRAQRECLRTLDMRGKVPGECKSYFYRGRLMWLDSISFDIFRRGLKENRGVFTVATYEQIINGPHTFKGMRRQEMAEAAPADQGPSWQASRAVGSGSQIDRHGPAPEVIPLNYFKRRKSPRVQYQKEIRINCGDTSFSANTLDISRCGLRVESYDAFEPAVGTTVTLTLPGFDKEDPRPLVNVRYQVVRVDSSRMPREIMLARQEQSDEVARAIDRFVAQKMRTSRSRRWIDPEDCRLTASAMLAGYAYCVSTPLIPLFVIKQPDGRRELRYAGVNGNNVDTLSVFKDSDGKYGLLDLLSAPQRLERICRLTTLGGEFLFAVIPSSGKQVARLVTKFECGSEREWFTFLRDYHQIDGFRVFKVIAHAGKRPDASRLSQGVEQLREYAADRALDMIKETEAVDTIALLIDVTAQIKGWKFQYVDDPLAKTSHDLTKIDSAAGSVELIPLDYSEQRSELRYRYPLSLHMQIDDDVRTVRTRDFSPRGLAIEMDEFPSGLAKGELVKISYPEIRRNEQSDVKKGLTKLFKKEEMIRLESIPYQVVGLGDEAPGILRLQLHPNPKEELVREYFDLLVARNRDKLLPDLTDNILAARSRLYSSLVVASAATLPVFLFRNKVQKSRFLSVAVPDELTSVSEFFEVAPNRFDFTVLSAPHRIEYLSKALTQDGRGEMLLYLYKAQAADSHSYEIHSAADFEFADAEEKRTFIDHGMNEEFVCMKIVLAPARPMQKEIMDRILSPLQHLSRSQAAALREQFESLVAVGDLVDVGAELAGGME